MTNEETIAHGLPLWWAVLDRPYDDEYYLTGTKADIDLYLTHLKVGIGYTDAVAVPIPEDNQEDFLEELGNDTNCYEAEVMLDAINDRIDLCVDGKSVRNPDALDAATHTLACFQVLPSIAFRSWKVVDDGFPEPCKERETAFHFIDEARAWEEARMAAKEAYLASGGLGSLDITFSLEAY